MGDRLGTPRAVGIFFSTSSFNFNSHMKSLYSCTNTTLIYQHMSYTRKHTPNPNPDPCPNPNPNDIRKTTKATTLFYCQQGLEVSCVHWYTCWTHFFSLEWLSYQVLTVYNESIRSLSITCLLKKVACLRPYHVEHTGSRPITEVKQRRAWLVLRWVTAWEHHVL